MEMKPFVDSRLRRMSGVRDTLYESNVKRNGGSSLPDNEESGIPETFS